MSTKDISRSALEGGRYNRNKDDRNESHRHERSRLREWLGNVSEDTEAAEASDPTPREPVRRGSTDKLNPCYRWLASKAGQPWAKVYSELATRFDTRNLASWHIVNQHMLSDVQGAGTTSDALGARYETQRFFIDDGGILRDRGKKHWRKRAEVITGPKLADVLAKVGQRRVYEPGYPGNYSSKLYWAWPGKGRWEHCPRLCKHGKAKHRIIDVTPANIVEMYTVGTHRAFREGDHWRKFQAEHFVPSWTMGKPFTKAEVAWWKTIHYPFRSKVRVGG
jgi:hypothetical protein